MNTINPIIVLAMTKKGSIRGLPVKPLIADQSMPSEPIPKPWIPEPSC